MKYWNSPHTLRYCFCLLCWLLPVKLAAQSANAPVFTTVSAASYRPTDIASGSIVAGFGANLAPGVAVATSLPLPTSLNGVSVRVRNLAGFERAARLFFVSPTQINYMVPEALLEGTLAVTVTLNDNLIAEGRLDLITIAPALFSANADGQGVAAAVALRINALGAQFFEPTSRSENGRQVPVPVDLGDARDDVYLLLFGTGFSGVLITRNVTLTIGGLNVGVVYAGMPGGFIGLDQVNAGPLPRALAGRGLVDVVLTANGRVANVVQILIK